MSNTNLREITIEELKLHNGQSEEAGIWVLIGGLVYDLSNYDHPGGNDILKNDLDNYNDKQDEFEDVGHSPSAIRTMKKYLIGKLKQN